MTRSRHERSARVWLRKEDVSSPSMLAGGVAVVIDVLRASTTVATALSNGARAVLPVASPEEARVRAAEANPPRLLAGERGAVLIQGFDLDNSPASFSRERVQGREIVLTTTNGTEALLRCGQAASVFVGALVNRASAAIAAARAGGTIHLVCCGSQGEVGLDDLLGAGAMLESLAGEGVLPDGDPAALALMAWREAKHSSATLARMLHESAGGRNLAAAGLEKDIEWCAAVDSLSVVPVCTPPRDQAGGRITRL